MPAQQDIHTCPPNKTATDADCGNFVERRAVQGSGTSRPTAAALVGRIALLALAAPATAWPPAARARLGWTASTVRF
jgi:hypothetical protein